MIELDAISDEAYESVQEIGNDKGTSGESDNVTSSDEGTSSESDNVTPNDKGTSGESDNVTPNDKYLLKMWYISLIISLIPIFAVPIFLLSISSKDLPTYFINALGSPEIIYMAVSLTAISTNDMSNMGTRKKDWLKYNQLFVIVAVLIYGVMSIAEYSHPKDYNICIAIILNVVFFVTTILLCRAAYLKDS